MANTASIRLKVSRLKTDVGAFKTATTSGQLTPEQVRKLAALLQDSVGILEDLLIQNNDLLIRGSKIGQN